MAKHTVGSANMGNKPSFESLIKKVSGSREDSFGNLVEKVAQKRYSEDVKKVDSTYVSKFFEDSNSFLSGSQKAIDEITWTSAMDSGDRERRYSTISDLGYRAKLIGYYLEKNKDRLDEKTYSELSTTLEEYQSGFTKVEDAFANANKYYSQWGTEKDYNRWDQYHDKTSSELAAILEGMEDGEEKEWLEEHTTSVRAFEQAQKKAEEDAKKWAELTGGYDPSKNRTEGKAGWDAYVARQEELAQKMKESVENSREPTWWERLLGYIGDIGSDTTLPGVGGSQVLAMSKEAQQKDTELRSPDERWTDEQRETFGYLWNTQRQKAYEYAFAINNMLNVDEEKAKIQGIKDSATDNFWAGAANTLGAIASAPAGLADYLSDLINYGAVGYIPAADGEITPFEYSQAVTGGISQHLNETGGTLDENIPIVGGKGWGDVYGLGTSIAQSALAAATGGQGQALITFFGSASAAGVDDAISRGATGEQALLYGTSVGAAEAVSEMIGIDNLMKIGASATGKQVFMNLIKQGAAEGLEEGFSSFFGNVADNLFMGDKSNFYRNVDAYMSAGLSEEEAKKKAWSKMAQDVAYDMLGGFVSGAAHAAPKTAYHTFRQNKNTKKLYGGSQGKLVEEALEIDPQNAFAQKMQGRLDREKNLSGAQLNRLVQQNEAALTAQDVDNIQKAVETRLTELGETGDVAAIAAALTKQAQNQVDYRKIRNEMNRLMAQGYSLADALEMADQTERQELSRTEKDLIANSKYGQRVANELNTENIRSGEYSSAWAEKLDTQRINVEEYSRLVEAAQQPQEVAGTAEGKVVTDVPKAAQAPQAAPVVGAETPAATGKESLQVVKETLTAEAAQEKPVMLEDVSKKYGAQAQAMIHTYQAGQDVAKYDKAYQAAYDMGMSGVAFSYLEKSSAAGYLTDTQKQLAYEAGQAASDAEAKALDAKNKAAANGKTGRKKGVVRGEGVTIADLKQPFNDTQGKAYKYLSTVAEVTGVDIVLYRSEAGPDGKYEGAQGRYRRSEPGTLYIDLNAGLSDIKSVDDLAKYAMLRTFSHEFTHFIENWNPIQYNELRKVVFDTLTQRGENVQDLIEDKQARNPGMSYDKASREVVAEAMTDILPDVNFVQELAQKHKNIFAKLLEKLKEFVDNLRDYFNSIGHNRSREANALKEQVGETVKYLDSIVQLFDKVAVQAVENYQLTVAVDEATGETSVVETKVETAVEEAAPAVEETTPAVEETTPAVEETTPAVEESREIPFD